MRQSDKSTGRQGDGESGAEESEGAAKHGSAVLTSKVDVPPLGSTSESLAGIAADAPIGLYAERTEPKTAEFLGQRGGTIASQKAVEDGLNWLGRHQGEDGHWGADCLGTGANSRCDKKAPCQGNRRRLRNWPDWPGPARLSGRGALLLQRPKIFRTRGERLGLLRPGASA